jgi:nucleoside-diphosphate-sugar epimerase
MLIGITGHKGVLAKTLIKYLKIKKFRISLYQHNILDYKKLSKWLKRVDIIIHLASVTSIKRVNANKNHARKVNFEATKYLVSCIKNTNKKLVFISSSHVYGSSSKKISENTNKSPITYYGYLKLLSEETIESNLNNYLIIRLFSYYSILQNTDFLIPSLIKKIKELKHQKLKIKNYNHIRDISSVDFVANQICLLILKNTNGIINCGSGKGIQIKDLAIKIAKIKFNKVVELDKRFKTKKITQMVCNSSKLNKITGIIGKDNLFKYL